mmetsp:Transcript_5601/g.10539  ORF Transcript_5601/g.10539 Transcript_5601/m.10539 type:complete len:285 (-) Transcript_5601:8-862(-)
MSCGNSFASRTKMRSGDCKRFPPLTPPTKARPAPAAPAALPPAAERLRMASCSTGSCFSHQGQPCRVNMMTTCSSPLAIALTMPFAKACCQPSSTGPSILFGSARRLNDPSFINTSSPLCTGPAGCGAAPAPALSSLTGVATRSGSADSFRCFPRVTVKASRQAKSNATKPQRARSDSRSRKEYIAQIDAANNSPGSSAVIVWSTERKTAATYSANCNWAASIRPAVVAAANGLALCNKALKAIAAALKAASRNNRAIAVEPEWKFWLPMPRTPEIAYLSNQNY